MTDEIKIYHVDDPNDAPGRRLSAFPTINPFVPTSLPQYVIPPVANSLYTAMQYYWYSAYQQGIAAQKHQQQQQQQQQHLNHANQLHASHLNHQLQAESPSSSTSSSSIHTNLNHLQSNNNNTHLSSLSTRVPSPSSSTSSSHHHHHQHNNHHSHYNNLHQHQAESPSSSTSSSNSIQVSHHHHHHHLHHLTDSHHLSSAQNNAHQHQNDNDCKINFNTTNINNSNNTTTTNNNSTHNHIKKPLNPFMIYMQKMRPEIVKRGEIKESAAINQLLGQEWRKLSKEEQEPYYKLAEEEKRLHAKKYPGWSARDNYANQKKKKKLKLKSISLNGLDQSDKKCRARFGLNNMSAWCKPCKRKKKCQYATGPTLKQ